jgi:hypothetical protein
MSTSFVGGGLGDAKLYIWDLAWWPHAIAHGMNPFVNPTVWAPRGVNMAWVTGLPGPALVMAPVTETLGPIVSSNLLALLAPPLAAWAGYLMCRRVTHRFWPSVAGGYLLGASTYMVGQMRGHLNLVLIFPIPLAIYLLLRRLDGSLGRWAFGSLFTLCLVGLFSISTEVFATATLFAAIALVGAILLGGRQLRHRLLPAAGLVAACYAVTAVIVSPLIYYTFHGAPPPPARDIAHASLDLLGFVLPRRYTVVGGSEFVRTTSHFTANMSEDGSYLGIPLLVIFGLFAWQRRRERSTWLLIGMALVPMLLSLGTVLHIAGKTSIPLPWTLLDKVPLIGRALPQRFILYTWIVAAVIVAAWLSAQAKRGWRIASWVLVGVSLLFLFPSVWAIRNLHGVVDGARVFSGGVYERYVPRDGIAIVITPSKDQNEMLWQAQTNFWFRLAVGYTGPLPAQVAKDPVVLSVLRGHPTTISSVDVARWVYAHDVKTIFITNGLTKVWDPMVSAISLPPVRVGKFTVYRIAPTATPPVEPSSSPGAQVLGTLRAPGLIQSFAFPSASGNGKVRFEAGTPAVVGVWATWCQTCSSQLAGWQRASTNAGVSFYGIAEASDPSSVTAALSAAGATFPVGLDTNGLVAGGSLPFTPLPVTLFVNAKGIVVHQITGPASASEITSLARRCLGQTPTGSRSPTASTTGG